MESFDSLKLVLASLVLCADNGKALPDSYMQHVENSKAYLLKRNQWSTLGVDLQRNLPALYRVGQGRNAYTDFVSRRKPFFASLFDDTTISKTDIALVKNMQTFFALSEGNRETVRKKLENFATKDEALGGIVAGTKSIIVDTDLYSECQEIAAELLPGVDLSPTGLILTREHQTAAKAANEPRYNTYRIRFKELKRNVDDAVTSLCRGSSLPVSELAAGLDRLHLPVLFNRSVPVEVNAAFKMFTLGSKLELEGQMPGVGKDVELNPNWTPDNNVGWYMRAIHDKLAHRDSEGTTPYYTKDFKKQRAAKKRDIIFSLIDAIPSLMPRWRDDMRKKPLSEEHLMACMLEIVYQVACRSGHRIGNTGGEDTYGLTVWMKKHVKAVGTKLDPATRALSPGYVEVKYPGKDNQPQHHLLPMQPLSHMAQAARAAGMLYRFLEDEDDFLWVVREGARAGARITADRLNGYLKEISGNSDFTLHKFRHAKGTGIALDALSRWEYNLEKYPGASFPQLEVERAFQAEMLAVGMALGHYNKGEVTWRTAVVNYVEPTVSRQFFDLAGVRLPTAVEAALRDNN